ncbi:MAG: hypothetical protein U0Q03_00125 [Acidimicrobiales bacterium]
MAESEYLLRCECGHVYDIRDRERGEFHVRVLSVERDPDDGGALRVMGNLRGGELPAGKELRLVRGDGAAVPIERWLVSSPTSDAARRKGQREMTVFTPDPDSFHANSCIRP